MREKEKKQQEVRKLLLENFITPKTTLVIVIRAVSQSGMTRKMSVFNDKMEEITFYVSSLCDLGLDKKGQLIIGGCGMDMTFWLANSITFNLWGEKKPKWLTGNGGSCLEWKAI